MASKEVSISNWCAPRQVDAEVRVYALDDHRDDHGGRLKGRMMLTVRTGASSLQVCPTAAEARDLIAALQWALEPVVAEAA